MSASPAFLALLCLIATGLLDMMFKLYTGQPRSRGMLVFGIGCVWVALQSLYMLNVDASLVFDSATLTYGLMAAVFVTASNILLIECLSHLPISMASTIYRLNTIPLVIIAFLFLHEDISFLRGVGIVMGLVTIFLLYQPTDSGAKLNRQFTFFILLIITASCIRALYGIFTKVGVNNGGDPTTMMFLSAIGWCVGGLGYAYFRERRVTLTRAKLLYIAVGGCLVFSIVWLLTTALTLGDASVVIPLTNMGFVAAFLFSVATRLELLTVKKSMAIGTAVVSVVLLSVSF